MNKRRILLFAIGPLGSALLSFISVPVITWFFSVEDVGRIAMLQVAISFAILLCCLGLDQAYMREYHESKDKAALLAHSLVPGLLLLIVILATIFLLDISLLSKLLFTLDSFLINAIVALCLIVAYISRFLSLILRMQERGLAYSMSQVLPKLLFLIVISSFVIFKAQKSFNNLLYAHAVSVVCVLIVFGSGTSMEWLPAIKKKFNRKMLISLLRFSLPLVFAGLASWGLNVMDRVFLRSMSTYGQLGIYSVASSIAAIATIFSGVFNTIWMPTVYKWIADGSDMEVVDRVSEHVLAAVYFVFVFFGLFSWIFTYLFPSTYHDVQYIIMACAAGPLLYTLSETTTIGIGITRKTTYAMIASCVAMVANGVGNYMLIPIHGAAGAAIATAISFFIFFILRTEFSILIWRTRDRRKIYGVTIWCITVSVYSAVWGSSGKWNIVAINSISFIVGLFLFANSLRIFHNELLNISRKCILWRHDRRV